MKVENKNAHRAADKEYFFATHVSDGDGSGDDVVMLLLTDKELERAAKLLRKTKKICQNTSQLFRVVMRKIQFFLTTKMLHSPRSRVVSLDG